MKPKSTWMGVVLAMFSSTVAIAARGDTGAPATAPATEAPLPSEGAAPAGSPSNALQSMWRFELGYRGAFVSGVGYDPFSTTNYFPQVSLSASRTVYTRGPFSFSPGLAWDYGKTGATARGDTTSLEVSRLVVPLEGRMHFGHWGYAFVRGAPGVARLAAQINDPSTPNAAPLGKADWLFAADLSTGYAFPLWPRVDTADRTARLWVQSDGGYGWVTDERLNLMPQLASGDPRITDGIDLGSLSLQGAFFRVAIALSY